MNAYDFHSPRYGLRLGAAVEVVERQTRRLIYKGQLLRGRLDPLPELDEEALRLLFQGLLSQSSFTLPLSMDLGFTAAGAVYEDGLLHVTPASMAAADQAKGCRGAAWLERPQRALPVVALGIVDQQDRVLLTQRPEGKSFAGYWEFPGGKIEEGESPELALCREVQEELGLSIWNSCLSPLTFVSHAYEGFHLMLLAYVCYKFDGTPQGREGQALKWWSVGDLKADLMPPANAPLIHAIQDLLG